MKLFRRARLRDIDSGESGLDVVLLARDVWLKLTCEARVLESSPVVREAPI